MSLCFCLVRFCFDSWPDVATTCLSFFCVIFTLWLYKGPSPLLNFIAFFCLIKKIYLESNKMQTSYSLMYLFHFTSATCWRFLLCNVVTMFTKSDLPTSKSKRTICSLVKFINHLILISKCKRLETKKEEGWKCVFLHVYLSN